MEPTTQSANPAASNQPSVPAPGPGPGESTVSVTGTILMAAYVMLLVSFSVYVLVKIWPHCITTSVRPASGMAAQNAPSNTPEQAAQTGASTSERPCKDPDWVVFFWGTGYWIWEEIRLLLIVIIAGALGGLLHVVRSLFWYVGHRDLRRSWMLMYILLPFSGSLLAVGFYFVIRGGFFPQANADQGSPIGFAALALLIGLFSAQAGLKLKQIFETIFTPAPPGANGKPQLPETPPPGANSKPPDPGALPPGSPAAVLKISGISPGHGPIGGDTNVVINGTNFLAEAAVRFGDVPAKTTTLVSSTRIEAVTPAHAAGTVDVIVTNKDGKSDTLREGYTYE